MLRGFHLQLFSCLYMGFSKIWSCFFFNRICVYTSSIARGSCSWKKKSEARNSNRLLLKSVVDVIFFFKGIGLKKFKRKAVSIIFHSLSELIPYIWFRGQHVLKSIFFFFACGKESVSWKPLDCTWIRSICYFASCSELTQIYIYLLEASYNVR